MEGAARPCLTRARPAQAADEPAPQGPGTLRDVAVAERPSKKTCHTSNSTSLAASGPVVWAAPADLGVLHSLPSHLNLASTSHRCTSNQKLFFLRPCGPMCDIWQLTDLAKPTTPLQLSAPDNPFDDMRYLGCSYGHLIYLGCSYGHLIFSDLEHCFLVDAYTGATVRSPNFKFTGNHQIYIGILLAPISSARSQLLLWSRSSMFQWQVGRDSWSQHPLPLDGEGILQIVLFKVEMFVMDCLVRLHTVCLAPTLSMQEVDVTFDFSVVPAKLVKVENLRNHALFVTFDRSPTFSCMSPDRWGGKSNHIYVASNSEDSQPWTIAEIGQATRFMWPSGHNLWVLPNLVYGVGR